MSLLFTFYFDTIVAVFHPGCQLMYFICIRDVNNHDNFQVIQDYLDILEDEPLHSICILLHAKSEDSENINFKSSVKETFGIENFCFTTEIQNNGDVYANMNLTIAFHLNKLKDESENMLEKRPFKDFRKNKVN